MSDILLQILSIAYAMVGVVATISYIPTIKDLWLHKKASANINSYFIWTACSLTTFFYSLFVLQDLLFRIVSGLNFTCCAIVLMLSLTLKRKK